MTYYFAGALSIPGTGIPNNVTGNCPHRHLKPETAQACIDKMDRAIKRGHGNNAFCDRQIIIQEPGEVAKIYTSSEHNKEIS